MRKNFLFPIACLLLLASCKFLHQERVNGNGNIVRQEIQVAPFDKIEVSGAIALRIASAASHQVSIETDENLVELVDVEIRGGTLVIKPKKGYSPRPTKDILVFAAAPDLKKIEGAGSVNVGAGNIITGTAPLALIISGAGNMRMDVDVPQVKVEINGSGEMLLKGQAEDLDVEVNGSGSIHAYDLQALRAHLELNGSSDAEINASHHLKVEVNGSGNVLYKGNPSVEKSIAGSGKIRKAS